jgi:hypothetical protein
LLVVFYRNKHRSAGEIAKEMLIVLSFFKPVIDLRRLIGGHEVDGAPIDTLSERNICKIVESVCESIPASIIAMVTLLLVGKWAWAPIVSIVISWITTAFKATSLTFSFDTDRKRRKSNPWFAPRHHRHHHHHHTKYVPLRARARRVSVRRRKSFTCE